MKVEKEDYIKQIVTANIIDSEEVNFLCSQKTLSKWKTALYFSKQRLKFTEKDKSIKLDLLNGGHMLVNLEKVGEWKQEESVYYVKKNRC